MSSLRHYLLIGALLLLLLPLGCRKQPEQSSASESASAALPTTSDGRTAAAESSSPSADGALRVVIVPDAPTAKNDLRAGVTGATGGVDFRWMVDGKVISGSEGAGLPHTAFRKGALVAVTVGSAGLEASAKVTIGNAPPEVVSVGYRPNTVFRGQDLNAQPVAEDIDGDLVSFSYLWVINGEEQPLETDATLPGDRFHKGDRIAVEVVPNDGETDGPIYRTGDIVVGDSPPRFTSKPPQSFRSAVYSYQAHAEDADGDPLTFHLVSGPQGMTIDAENGLVQWPVGQNQAGEHLVKIEVSDEDGQTDVQQYRLNITLKE